MKQSPILLLLAACSGSSEVVCDGTPDVEFGTGDQTFILLEEGDPMPIFDGPQGGSHLYGAVDACNLEGPLDIQFSILDETLDQYIGNVDVYGRSPRPTRHCCGEVVALQAFLSIPSPGSGGTDTGYGYGGIADQLDGHDLTMMATVVDATGREYGMIRHYKAVDGGLESDTGASYGR